MKILIIEDEYITAEELEKDIQDALPDARILARLESIEDTLHFLKTQPAPDLIFSDIQLADGLSFEIFEQIAPPCPVIFCTAFDEYAIRAFQNNGIDYILKPFNRQSIVTSLAKFQNLKQHFQTQTPPIENKKDKSFNEQIQKLLAELRPATHRSNILVQHRGKYFPISTNDIAFFCTEHETVWLTKLNGERYPTNQILDDLEHTLNTAQFYRANRQFIINFDAVKEFEPHFNRKLSIKLSLPTPVPLLISKEKTTQFMRWMENLRM
jgi:two-component system, LytTR family, response regulator LytT